ncbi:MAG TPA: PIN domain-containing protein [Candidatus Acidoferrum sp.]|nr:PIN domain-containing protein [Candidatus Acidoferrum sp.]
MIIVDSNIYIFGELEGMPENKLALSKLYESYKSGRLGINAIIASEVFHKLQKFFGSTEAAAKVSKMVSDQYADFLQFTPEMIVRASKLARDFQMTINDAMIAQQAIETGAAILTDNVKDFKKVGMIKVIPLRG